MKPWLRVVAVVVLPAALLLSVVAAYRVLEIPVRDDFSADVYREALSPIQPDEAETAHMYRSALALLTPLPESYKLVDSPEKRAALQEEQFRAWAKQNGDALQLTLEATKRPRCAFVNPANASFFLRPKIEAAGRLSRLLWLSGKELESEDKLDEAFDHYIALLRLAKHVADRGRVYDVLSVSHAHRNTAYRFIRRWAANPDQTSARILGAMRRIETEATSYPASADAVTVELGLMRRALTEDSIELNTDGYADNAQGLFLLGMLHRFFPWEKERALRLIDVIHAESIASIGIADGTRPYERLSQPTIFPGLRRFPVVGSLQFASTELLKTTPLLPPGTWTSGEVIQARLNALTEYRATLIILALCGYRQEHGRLPERLETLLGKYFETLPLDPWSARRFGYLRQGVPSTVIFGSYNEITKPHQPFVWSTGPEGARIVQKDVMQSGPGGKPIPRYVVLDRQGRMIKIPMVFPIYELQKRADRPRLPAEAPRP